MSHYATISISGLMTGFFAAIQAKTGIDASPTGIGLQIMNALEPIFPPNTTPQMEYVRMAIILIPLATTVFGILKVKHKILGIMIFAIVAIGSYVFITTF